MDTSNIKQGLISRMAGVARAFAHEHRLVLLERIAQGERNVEDLATATDLSVANASQHLRQLRRAGLVEVRRDGRRSFNRLADDQVLELNSALWRVGSRQLAHLDRLMQ